MITDNAKSKFFKKLFQNTIRVSNSLDPDQDQHSIGPDLGSSCLQRLISNRQRLMRKLNFSKNSFKNTIRVSNSLEPDQHHHYVGPDLGPSCLQRLISRQQELMMTCYLFHRLLKRLRKKNKSQIELEQKEQGFSVYVNGPHKDGQVAQTQRGTSSKNIPTQPLKTSRTPKTAGGENKQGFEKQAGMSRTTDQFTT